MTRKYVDVGKKVKIPTIEEHQKEVAKLREKKSEEKKLNEQAK